MRAPIPDAGDAVRRTARAARTPLVGALVCVAASGCRPDAPPVGLTPVELTSPAGEGSGEPFLSSAGDIVFLSWLERTGADTHELRFARFDGAEWGAPTVIASSDRFLVNWADFPSVQPGSDGSLWAHWLYRGSLGGYDYSIRITSSRDGGATWSEPWTPHEDGTPTEHGFVSAVEFAGAQGFLWLDGRRHVAGPGGEEPTRETALYFRAAGGGGAAGPETLVDPRVCDCCQTDLAVTSAGPVAVYRDRSPEEVRDIRVARYREGAWREGDLVHEDGWETAACPVNGPAVAARGADVAVAWFTGAEGIPRVQVAFSDDDAQEFGQPEVVDDGNPAGRVDVVMLEDGSALVSWLERTGGERAEVRVRRVEANGRRGESLSVSTSSGERASGFPRLAGGDGAPLIVAWTDVSELAPRVRVARIDLDVDPRGGTASPEGR